MELVAWRLENEADPRIGDEVEPDLVRRARCSAGDRAGKAPVDCAVQVAAQDAFDLGMACDDFGKSRGIVEAEIVHVGNARREWQKPTAYEPTPTGVTISCIVDLVSSAVDRPASVLWTSIMSFARSVGVVHSPAAVFSG